MLFLSVLYDKASFITAAFISYFILLQSIFLLQLSFVLIVFFLLIVCTLWQSIFFVTAVSRLGSIFSSFCILWQSNFIYSCQSSLLYFFFALYTKLYKLYLLLSFVLLFFLLLIVRDCMTKKQLSVVFAFLLIVHFDKALSFQLSVVFAVLLCLVYSGQAAPAPAPAPAPTGLLTLGALGLGGLLFLKGKLLLS